MKFRRIFTPVVLIVTLLVQFLPGTVFAPRPVAATTTCDAAEFVADVTIPDGTSVAPGASLSKTWRLKNIGTCTWSTSYAIVFYTGTKMGAPSVVNLPTSVAPGATVDVTVNITAPTAPGHYRGYWMLRNASNVLFGVGPYGTYCFFIDIVVTGSPTTTTAYDFVANCSAANWTSGWTTGARALLCPGVDGSASGYVLQSAAPQLEDGTLATTPGLIVAPNNDTDGFISGTYPAFTVQSGDRFQSIVSCQYGVSSCYVTFRLDYQIDDGLVYTLWSFREKTEGSYYRASVDLSSLAGRSVKFILKVTASGSPAGDRVIWGGARIVRAGGAPTPPPVSTCDKAAFVTDVNYPDGTSLASGTPFTKIWRVKNVGTCTWTTSYRLVFAGGDIMGASASA
ncbi:MAG TPA: NBR1-Ig-like domain-containing protein, partial [Anaerolineales bacterium]